MRVRQVSSLLCLRPAEAEQLCFYYKWNMSSLQEEWFNDPERARERVGLSEARYTCDRACVQEPTDPIAYPSHRPCEKSGSTGRERARERVRLGEHDGALPPSLDYSFLLSLCSCGDPPVRLSTNKSEPCGRTNERKVSWRPLVGIVAYGATDAANAPTELAICLRIA